MKKLSKATLSIFLLALLSLGAIACEEKKSNESGETEKAEKKKASTTERANPQNCEEYFALAKKTLLMDIQKKTDLNSKSIFLSAKTVIGMKKTETAELVTLFCSGQGRSINRTLKKKSPEAKLDQAWGEQCKAAINKFEDKCLPLLGVEKLPKGCTHYFDLQLGLNEKTFAEDSEKMCGEWIDLMK